MNGALSNTLIGYISLTQREHEVAVLLAAGLTTKEIGERLCITPSAARNHVSSVVLKLDAQNRTHAAYKLYSLFHRRQMEVQKG